MGLLTTAFSLGIIILLVALLAIVFVFQGYLGAKMDIRNKLSGLTREKPTKFLDDDEGGLKCEICYGAMEGNLLAECKCGKIFHEACARPTGSCPYCGEKFENMRIREPTKRMCPVCHQYFTGTRCPCGTVAPKKDGTFVCKCGNIVDWDKPVCKKCGAVYEQMPLMVLTEKK